MTVEEKQEWLEIKYPLTIISDRYDGTYSGASWLAFPLYCDEVPSAVDGYDDECAAFWASNSEPVGKGNSAQSALDNLIKQMREFEPEESEDEGMLDSIIESLRFYALHTRGINDKVDKQVAWLEKQKEPHFTKRNALFDKCVAKCDPEIMQRVSDEVDEMLEKEQKSERINIAKMVAKYGATDEYVDGEYKGKPINCMIRAYEQGIRDTLLKVKEQKPVEVKDSFSNANFVRGYESGYADAKREQKPAEWSEEDEAIYKEVLHNFESVKFKEHHYATGKFTYAQVLAWLKSLRPSWKPSEGQMEALLWCTAHLGGADHRVLAELYEHLKKL